MENTSTAANKKKIENCLTIEKKDSKESEKLYKQKKKSMQNWTTNLMK